MIRKNIRLRKEYLATKAKEQQERSRAEKKRKIKDNLDNDKPVPNEYRREKDALLKELSYDDKSSLVPRRYVLNAMLKPRALVTSTTNTKKRSTGSRRS